MKDKNFEKTSRKSVFAALTVLIIWDATCHGFTAGIIVRVFYFGWLRMMAGSQNTIANLCAIFYILM